MRKEPFVNDRLESLFLFVFLRGDVYSIINWNEGEDDNIRSSSRGFHTAEEEGEG